MIWRWIAGGISLVVLALVGGTWWVFHEVSTVSRNERSVNISIQKGEGIRSVAQELFSANLIPNRQAWLAYAGLTGRFKTLLPGTYVIEPQTSGKALLERFSLGPIEDNEVTVTIHEGQHLSDIATLLETKGVVSADAFLTLARHPSSFLSTWPTDLFASKPTSVDLEGYLFPDTYRFFKNSTAETVIQRMVETMDAKLTTDLRTDITASGHSIHEIITMASILEREGKNTADWAMIADIFWRRIALGMPLQSDATVNYALGNTNQATTSIADTQTDSPYNTYVNKGLPPGPIDNPGLETIKAAIHPTPNEYLFFITVNGKAVFARTYPEHLRNKHTYLK